MSNIKEEAEKIERVKGRARVKLYVECVNKSKKVYSKVPSIKRIESLRAL